MNNSINRTIYEVLTNLGIAPSSKGFKYLLEAIKMAVDDPEYGELVTKLIYPELAKIYNKTESSIERAIRYAIITMPIVNPYRDRMFGASSKPQSNKKFIAHIANYIRFAV